MLVCDLCGGKLKVKKLSIGVFTRNVFYQPICQEIIFEKDLCKECLEEIKEKIKNS